jgi:hypothetical protein
MTAASYGKMFAEANCCAAERAARVHRVLVAQPPQARLAEDVAARISLQNTTIILKNWFLTGRKGQKMCPHGSVRKTRQSTFSTMMMIGIFIFHDTLSYYNRLQ